MTLPGMAQKATPDVLVPSLLAQDYEWPPPWLDALPHGASLPVTAASSNGYGAVPESNHLSGVGGGGSTGGFSQAVRQSFVSSADTPAVPVSGARGYSTANAGLYNQFHDTPVQPPQPATGYYPPAPQSTSFPPVTAVAAAAAAPSVDQGVNHATLDNGRAQPGNLASFGTTGQPTGQPIPLSGRDEEWPYSGGSAPGGGAAGPGTVPTQPGWPYVDGGGYRPVIGASSQHIVNDGGGRDMGHAPVYLPHAAPTPRSGWDHTPGTGAHAASRRGAGGGAGPAPPPPLVEFLSSAFPNIAVSPSVAASSFGTSPSPASTAPLPVTSPAECDHHGFPLVPTHAPDSGGATVGPSPAVSGAQGSDILPDWTLVSPPSPDVPAARRKSGDGHHGPSRILSDDGHRRPSRILSGAHPLSPRVASSRMDGGGFPAATKGVWCSQHGISSLGGEGQLGGKAWPFPPVPPPSHQMDITGGIGPMASAPGLAASCPAYDDTNASTSTSPSTSASVYHEHAQGAAYGETAYGGDEGDYVLPLQPSSSGVPLAPLAAPSPPSLLTTTPAPASSTRPSVTESTSSINLLQTQPVGMRSASTNWPRDGPAAMPPPPAARAWSDSAIPPASLGGAATSVTLYPTTSGRFHDAPITAGGRGGLVGALRALDMGGRPTAGARAAATAAEGYGVMPAAARPVPAESGTLGAESGTLGAESGTRQGAVATVVPVAQASSLPTPSSTPAALSASAPPVALPVAMPVAMPVVQSGVPMQRVIGRSSEGGAGVMGTLASPPLFGHPHPPTYPPPALESAAASGTAALAGGAAIMADACGDDGMSASAGVSGGAVAGHETFSWQLPDVNVASTATRTPAGPPGTRVQADGAGTIPSDATVGRGGIPIASPSTSASLLTSAHRRQQSHHHPQHVPVHVQRAHPYDPSHSHHGHHGPLHHGHHGPLHSQRHQHDQHDQTQPQATPAAPPIQRATVLYPAGMAAPVPAANKLDESSSVANGLARDPPLLRDIPPLVPALAANAVATLAAMPPRPPLPSSSTTSMSSSPPVILVPSGPTAGPATGVTAGALVGKPIIAYPRSGAPQWATSNAGEPVTSDRTSAVILAGAPPSLSDSSQADAMGDRLSVPSARTGVATSEGLGVASRGDDLGGRRDGLELDADGSQHGGAGDGARASAAALPLAGSPPVDAGKGLGGGGMVSMSRRLAVPPDFNVLLTMSCEELLTAATDPDAFAKLFAELEATKRIATVHAALRASMATVAESTLDQEAVVKELLNQMQIIYTSDLAEPRAELEALLRRQEALLDRLDPSCLRDIAACSAAAADEDSEKLLSQFMASRRDGGGAEGGRWGTGEFLEAYKASRKRFHLLNLKRRFARHHSGL
eukprot:jgi/Mesvir1/1040/Mv17564-RA.1